MLSLSLSFLSEVLRDHRACTPSLKSQLMDQQQPHLAGKGFQMPWHFGIPWFSTSNFCWPLALAGVWAQLEGFRCSLRHLRIRQVDTILIMPWVFTGDWCGWKKTFHPPLTQVPRIFQPGGCPDLWGSLSAVDSHGWQIQKGRCLVQLPNLLPGHGPAVTGQYACFITGWGPMRICMLQASVPMPEDTKH